MSHACKKVNLDEDVLDRLPNTVQTHDFAVKGFNNAFTQTAVVITKIVDKCMTAAPGTNIRQQVIDHAVDSLRMLLFGGHCKQQCKTGSSERSPWKTSTLPTACLEVICKCTLRNIIKIALLLGYMVLRPLSTECLLYACDFSQKGSRSLHLLGQWGRISSQNLHQDNEGPFVNSSMQAWYHNNSVPR